MLILSHLHGIRSQPFFSPLVLIAFVILIVVALIRFFCWASNDPSSLCSTVGELYIRVSSRKLRFCYCKTSKLWGEASWTLESFKGWQPYILADRSELLKSKLLILIASTFFNIHLTTLVSVWFVWCKVRLRVYMSPSQHSKVSWCRRSWHS